ncbi:MAG: O-antigen ligase family protein [Candidatus Sulfotelmatobacter sp.]
MGPTNISEIHRRERSAQAENVLLYGIFGLLLFGPLAFGAVEPWSIFILEAGSAALFLFWTAKQAVLDRQLKVIWNPIFLPMGAFAVLIVAQFAFHRTAYPHDTATLALQYVAYATLCFLAGQTLVRGAQARKLTLIFSIYGGALAIFALLQGISSNGKLYWLRQPRGGWIYGPYVNHNHYAGLMEMLVPIPLIVSLTRLAPPKVRAVAAATAAVMVGTIFLSGSRGGMLAIVAELIILAALLVRQKRSLRTAIGIGLFLAIVVGLLVWIGGGELSKRIATAGPGHTELSSDIRTYINRDGLRMFLKKPVLGWGLGTFPIVYPEFRTFYTNFFVNQAHNDYLQLLVETGLLGFATMVWLLIIIYTRALKKIKHWPTEMSGAITLTCLLGLSGILVHSAVDFNLQIPANAALFYVLCTIAASEPFAKPARKRRAVRTKSPEETLEPREVLPQSATNF